MIPAVQVHKLDYSGCMERTVKIIQIFLQDIRKKGQTMCLLTKCFHTSEKPHKKVTMTLKKLIYSILYPKIKMHAYAIVKLR